MSFKLSKAQLAEKAELIREAQEAQSAVMSQIVDYKAAVEDYKAKVEAMKDWAHGCGEQFRSDHDEKSEKWQEGERGEKASSLADAYENFEPEEPAELDEEPSWLSEPIDEFDGLPSSIDEV